MDVSTRQLYYKMLLHQLRTTPQRHLIEMDIIRFTRPSENADYRSILKHVCNLRLKSSFPVPALAVGTLAFDVRVGLYDDPPNKETVKMVKATFEAFSYVGKLSSGLESLVFRFMKTPSYWKFCEAQDTAIRISQEIVDRKILELKKTEEEGEPFAENGGRSMFVAKIARIIGCKGRLALS